MVPSTARLSLRRLGAYPPGTVPEYALIAGAKVKIG
jgi:hypothetical protein